MSSIKKMCTKIKKKFKHLTINVNYINKVSGKFKLIIFFDILWCRIRYETSINEYRIYEYYNINKDKRKTYLSMRKHNRLSWMLINEKIINVLEDKNLFMLRFKNYFKRNVINVNDLNFKECESLCLDNKKITCRSNTGSYINSYKTYDIKDFRSPAYMIDQIKKDNKILIEKEFNQLNSFKKISENLVFINVTTLNGINDIKIVSSNIKFREKNDIISGFIDIKTGKIKGHFKDKDGKNYSSNFNDFEIPKFNKIIELSKSLAKEMEEIYEIEWSFSINNRGVICLMDANKKNDFVFEQTPEFLVNKIGLLPLYKKNIKRSIFKN